MATTKPAEKATAGPISGPLFCLLLALFASLLVRYTQVPWWAPGAIALPAAAAHWFVLRSKHSRFAAVFAASCWVAGAGWATWTGLLGYGWAAGIVLLALGVVGAILAQALAAPAPTPAVPPPPPKLENPRAAKMRTSLDSALGLRDPGTQCRVDKIEDWTTGAGYTAYVSFPPSARMTLPRVQAEAAALASMLQLPNGGQVKVSGGKGHHQVVVAVTTDNRLEKDVPLPHPTKPTSLLRPLPIGHYSDGTVAAVELRQPSLGMVSRRGGGKSVAFAALTAQLLSCNDSLLWMIDCNGGSAATNWMLPFATGEIDRPVIDWVATDLDEALIMSQAAVAAAKYRKRAYAGLMAKNNSDILPISRDIPAITIVLDEGHMVLAPDAGKLAAEVAANLNMVMKIGRAMAVQFHFTSQRGTLSYVPADIKVATQVRMVGPVEQDSEIAHFLDWDRSLTSRDLTGRGQWYLRRSLSDPPTRMKGFGVTPEDQMAIARKVEPWRPELDDLTRSALGDDYERRWERSTGQWLREIAGHPIDPRMLMLEAKAATNPALAGELGAAKIIAQVKAQSVAAQVPAPAQSVAADPAPHDDDDAWFDEAMADAVPEPAGQTVEQLLAALGKGPAALYSWIVDAGDEGTKTSALVERATAGEEPLTIRRATVQTWLALLTANHLIRRKGREWARWVAVSADERAAQEVGASS